MSVARALGVAAEQAAQAFLRTQGYEIVAVNFVAPKIGEIDIIACLPDLLSPVLVFVEVRARSVGVFGQALETITTAKQRRISRTALYFVQQHSLYQNHAMRFDVIGVDVVAGVPLAVGFEHWIQGAFLGFEA